jgi:hypothetical protein
MKAPFSLLFLLCTYIAKVATADNSKSPSVRPSGSVFSFFKKTLFTKTSDDTTQISDLAKQLLNALVNDKYDVIKNSLENGFDVNYKYQDGATLLMFAAYCGNVPITKLLIGHGADVNAQDLKKGCTALMNAAGAASTKDFERFDYYMISEDKKVYLEMVQLLVKSGADPKIQDIQGHSALDYTDDDEIINYLNLYINPIWQDPAKILCVVAASLLIHQVLGEFIVETITHKIPSAFKLIFKKNKAANKTKSTDSQNFLTFPNKALLDFANTKIKPISFISQGDEDASDP